MTNPKPKPRAGLTLIELLLGISVVLSGILLVWRWFNSLPPCAKKTETNLIALGQQQKAEGQGVFLFFVGVGSIGEDEYFYYYSGTEEEGYTLNKTKNNNNVKLFEDASESATLKIDNCLIPTGFEFHIPKGSIVRDFTLNL